MAQRRQRGYRGTGSIHKDSDGYYVAAITLPPGPDGQRHRLVRKSKVSAADAKAKLGAAQAGERGTIDGTTTVAEWVAFWLVEVVPGTGVKPGTAASYRKVLHRDALPHLVGVTLAELGPEHITHMLNALEAAGLGPATRAHVRDVLSVALNTAEAWGKLTRNPVRFTARPKAAPVRDEWSSDEAKAILQAAGGDRWEAFAVVMMYLGLRPSEALALRWQHLELGGRPALKITVAKSEAGVRTLPLPPPVADALRAHRARQAAERLAAAYWHDPGLVFATDIGAEVDARHMRRWWHEQVAAAGLPPRRLYSCRHTAATLMLEYGVPLEVVSAILGHAGLAITADVYAHVGDRLKQGAADVMGQVLG